MLDLTVTAYENWRHTAHAMVTPSPLDAWEQAGEVADAWALQVAAELLRKCPGGWPDTLGHFDTFFTPTPAWQRLLQWQIEGEPDPAQFRATLVLPSGRTVLDRADLEAMLHYVVHTREDRHG